MHTRKLLTIACALLACTTAALSAETVMVYVSSQTGHDDYLLSAVEAGVMDVFFDSGHIVFNAGTYERISDSDIQRRYWIRNTARQGGATLAIEIEVDLQPHDNRGADSSERLFADTAGFRLIQIEPAELLKSGAITAQRRPSRADRDKAAFELGIKIARAALEP